MLRRLARKDGKIIVIARSKASAERRGNLAKSLGTEGRDCHAYWLARTRGERLLRLLARKDEREGLPRLLARNDGRKMARKDGKIIVIARSKASAERRGNLAKSLSDGREGLPRRLARKDGRKIARKDTRGEIASPAGSQ